MKRSLKIKIMTIFLMILFMFALSSMWSIFNFNQLSKAISNIMEANYRSIEAAQNMIIAIERQDSAELAHMFSQNEETVKAFNDNEKVFITWLSRAEDNITEKGEAEILSAIDAYYGDYIVSFDQLMAMDRLDNQKVINDYYYEVVFPIFEKTKDACRELLAINQKSMLDRKETAQDIANQATLSTIFLSLSVIGVGLILVTILSNRIVTPLYLLIDKTKRIAEGEYNQRLDVTGNDEIAQMSEAFNIMAEKLVSYDEKSIMTLTEEKNKSEAIVSSIGDGILVTDHEHRIQLVNRMAERIFGILEKEVLNKHLLEVVNHEKLFTLFKMSSQHPYDQTIKKHDEIELQSDKGVHYYYVSVRPIQLKTGDSFGTVALIQDITKFKEVDQLKSDFIATVSHEFRTPLTSITMGVELLLEDTTAVLTDRQKELIDVIRDDSERLNVLVGELLDLSKLESGKLQMDYQAHPISEAFEHVMNAFKIQMADIEAQFRVVAPEDLKKVRVDMSRIIWVVSNLVANALRYIPKDGTGRIELSAKEVYGKQIIAIRDNGSGISDDIQKHIFNKFVQGTESIGGAGLGLAICKEIVRAHGGDIWVESHAGEGTTFFFTINTV